jgi:PAS domain-containing protein
LHGLPEAIRELEANNQVEAIGTFPADWVGVPLKTKDRTIGVLALQSYSEGITFSEEDLKILIFVSTQVASAIERRHAEDALRTSQQWFSKVFNLSPNPMGINRVKDGRYVDVNNSLLEITGYTHDEVIGKTSDDLNTWASPEQKEEFLQLLRQQRKIKISPNASLQKTLCEPPSKNYLCICNKHRLAPSNGITLLKLRTGIRLQKKCSATPKMR